MIYYLAVAQTVQSPPIPTAIFVTFIIGAILGLIVGRKWH